MAEAILSVQNVSKQPKKLFCKADFWLFEKKVVPLHSHSDNAAANANRIEGCMT
jgi:hypothetical protein